MNHALRDVFGLSTWRPGQKAAITASLDGRDVVVLLPTGGGKSLCYQLPAVVRHRDGAGPTLVISPLIALMDDQVASLVRRGIPAIAAHGRSRPTLAELRAQALIYASPERVKAPAFRKLLKQAGIAAIAVDEAHCIAQWGHDFRPEYALLGVLRDEFDVPITALTATATPKTLGEIANSLHLDDPIRVVADLRRPNLSLAIEHHRGDLVRTERTAALIREHLGTGRAIVYAATRKRVRAIAEALVKAKIPAGWYHAGRTDLARARAQAAFDDSRTRVLVATTAFGMGVDVPDVRLVVHAEAPGTLEGWWQEAGRAGRDGKPAHAVLLWSPKDEVTHARLRGESAAPGVDAGWDALKSGAYGSVCREQTVVSWLSGETSPPCGRCDACRRPTDTQRSAADARATVAAGRKARADQRKEDLAVTPSSDEDAAILAFVDAMRRPCGRALVAKGLRGSTAKAVRRRGLVSTEGHGSLKHLPELAIIAAIDRLLAEGRLARKGKKYPTVWMPSKPVRSADATPKARAPRHAGLNGKLRDLRKKEARKRRWRAYQVFDNATIAAIVDARPRTFDDLLAIKGLGEKRIERYGKAILELVAGDDGRGGL